MRCKDALNDASTVRFEQAEAKFSAIAEVFLNRVELRVADTACRLVEVEFYLLSEAHADPFTHAHAIQGQMGRWYVHRVGDGYKGGSFKGLDFTFGAEGVHGGVLVRGIETPDGKVIDGPCLCVEHLMRATGSDTVDALDGAIFPKPVWDPTNPVCLVDREGPTRPVHATARVGLTFKRLGAQSKAADYIIRRYRFLTTPRATKKGRLHVLLSLLEQGRSPAEIRALTGSPQASISRYEALRQAGAGRTIDEFYGKGVDNETLCLLHGLLHGVGD